MRLPMALALFLVLAVPPVGASPETAEYEQSDPSGDVSVLIETPLGVPLSPASSYVDLTALRIENEDETGFDIVLELAQLKVATGSTGLCCFMGLSVNGEFQLADA